MEKKASHHRSGDAKPYLSLPLGLQLHGAFVFDRRRQETFRFIVASLGIVFSLYHSMRGLDVLKLYPPTMEHYVGMAPFHHSNCPPPWRHPAISHAEARKSSMLQVTISLVTSTVQLSAPPTLLDPCMVGSPLLRTMILGFSISSDINEGASNFLVRSKWLVVGTFKPSFSHKH